MAYHFEASAGGAPNTGLWPPASHPRFRNLMVARTFPLGGHVPTLLTRCVLWDVDLPDASTRMDGDLTERARPGVDELVRHACRYDLDLAVDSLDLASPTVKLA